MLPPPPDRRLSRIAMQSGLITGLFGWTATVLITLRSPEMLPTPLGPEAPLRDVSRSTCRALEPNIWHITRRAHASYCDQHLFSARRECRFIVIFQTRTERRDPGLCRVRARRSSRDLGRRGEGRAVVRSGQLGCDHGGGTYRSRVYTR